MTRDQWTVQEHRHADGSLNEAPYIASGMRARSEIAHGMIAALKAAFNRPRLALRMRRTDGALIPAE